MIRIEQYKLFHNSQDFEWIFKKSKEDLSKEFGSESFVSDVIKPSLEKKHCLLLYLADKIIGYEVALVKKRKISGGYTFILSEHRGKGYSYKLREEMYNLLRKSSICVEAFIRKNNIASIESAKKTAKKLNLKLEEENVYDKNLNLIGKKYKINELN
jgi:GNAT superfamily N-acetyltransferase